MLALLATGGGLGCGGGGAGGVAPPDGVTAMAVQTCLAPTSASALPQTLAETGCMDPRQPTRLAASVVPYRVNSPLWSDGAEKLRGLALPAGGRIHVKSCAANPGECPQGAADDGKWVFPVGTVMVKSFVFDDKLVETRLFTRIADTLWTGFTYAWNEAQTEATLVPDDRVKVTFDTGKQAVPWQYPNRIDCTKCHTVEAGSTLGPETAQMNRADDGGGNQLDRFRQLGLFDAALPEPVVPALMAPSPPPAGAAEATTREARARAYLHANCAYCHRPDGEDPEFDLRFAVPLGQTHICDVAPTRGDLVPSNRLLAPGSPEASLVWVRMNILPEPDGGKTARMPQLATAVVDDAGQKVVADWIRSLTGCP